MKNILALVSEKPLLSLAVLFATSRAILYSLFPFRIDFLPMLNQLLDIHLLRTDLWNSLWQLHATPPLYNLYVAGVVSVFPESMWAGVFTVLHFFLGLGIVLMTYNITKKFGVSHWLSFTAATLVLAHPILFRFEIIPFYTFPLAFLLLLSLNILLRFIEKKRVTCLVSFLGVLTVLVLFRNFFHVIFFFIPVAVGFCLLVYKLRKELFGLAVVVSILFLGIGLLPSIKNQIQYGIFSSSTWQGMQLFSMTYFVPQEDIETLVAEGSVTPLALLPRFQNPEIYYEYYKETIREGNPALNTLYKSIGEKDANFNNWIYIQTAKEYGENTVAIISRYPEYFIPRFINSVYIYFGVANYRYFDTADEWLIFDGNLLKQAFQAGKYFIQPALLAIVYLMIIWLLIKNLWGAYTEKQLFSDNSPVLLYSLFLLVYVFGVSNIVELGENYTARVPIDPLIIILFFYGLALTFAPAKEGSETSPISR
jgi:hypothetical protein